MAAILRTTTATGAPGPRIDVLMRMFERVIEYEDEVRRGERIPQTILNAQQREHARIERNKKQRNKRAAKRSKVCHD